MSVYPMTQVVGIVVADTYELEQFDYIDEA